MSIEELRAKVLAYSPEMTYPVVLDRDLKHNLIEARKNLAALQAERQKIIDSPPELTGQRYDQATPTADIDERIMSAEAAVGAAEEAIRPESLVLVWRRLSADEYQARIDEHSDEKGIISTIKLGDHLLGECYLRTESASGGDVGLAWDEARAPLDHGDIETLRLMIIGHHRIGAGVPFDPRSSGRPATS